MTRCTDTEITSKPIQHDMISVESINLTLNWYQRNNGAEKKTKDIEQRTDLLLEYVITILHTLSLNSLLGHQPYLCPTVCSQPFVG